LSRSRGTDLVVNLLLSASVTASLLVGSEALCRWREEPSKPLDAPDRVTDWEREWGDDFYVMRSDSPGWPPSDDFNRDGVRDRARGHEKPRGTRRVVCLGDSVTLGYGLRHHASYPSQLQARLDENGPGTEVMTVALMGWSTRQERLAYERIARRYQPDLVLLGICLNDLQDLENNLSRPPQALVWLHERSALLRRIIDAQGRQIRSVRELVADPDSSRVRESYTRLFEEIRRLRDEVDRDGGRLAVVVFPFADQVPPEPMAATPQRQIEAFCARESIPFRDLLPGLQAVGRGAFIPGDHLHLSAEGNVRVAEALAGSGLVPSGWATSADLARALGRVGDLAPSVLDVPVLAKLVATGTTPFRAQAAWALGRVGAEARSAWAPLAAQLDQSDEASRLEAARALGRIGAREARPALFHALGDERQGVRWAAVDALAAIGLAPSDDAGRLRNELANRDDYVRAFAAWELGEMGAAASDAAPAVASLLADPVPGVRSVASTTLGRLGKGGPAIADALGHALRDVSWAERWRAARALGIIGPTAATGVPFLAAALTDNNERVRREAAKALGRLGPAAEQALPALVTARRDPSDEVRAAATAVVDRLTAR
jgi:HEAT repeat protein/lysophospholipase L1-like esterase